MSMNNYYVKSAHDSIDKLRDEIVRLEAVAAGVSGKVMDVKPCSFMGNIMYPASYTDTSRYGCDNSYEAICKRALVDADAKIAMSREAHEANKAAIANNVVLVESITRLMTNAGIPESYSTFEYTSGRSMKRKEVKHIAGWKTDLTRVVKTNDGIDGEERAYMDAVKRIEEYRRTEKEKADKIKRDEEAEASKKVSLQRLAVMLVKYSLPAEASWRDVLDHILSKDKYLRLAHYLALNRGDWSDGYNYAKIGIDGFKVESPDDKAIYDCITSHFGVGWDGDGRCFRDCKWSYDVIFGLVKDEALMADYNIARENTSVF